MKNKIAIGLFILAFGATAMANYDGTVTPNEPRKYFGTCHCTANGAPIDANRVVRISTGTGYSEAHAKEDAAAN